MTNRQIPKGIAILSALTLVFAISVTYFALILWLGHFPHFDGPNRILGRLGLRHPFITLHSSLLALVLWTLLVGMVGGRLYGWYVGSFTQLAHVAGGVLAYFDLPHSFSDERQPDIISFLAVILSILIYLYFYSKNVREFFSLSFKKCWKLGVSQVVVYAIITAVVSIASIQ